MLKLIVKVMGCWAIAVLILSLPIFNILAVIITLVILLTIEYHDGLDTGIKMGLLIGGAVLTDMVNKGEIILKAKKETSGAETRAPLDGDNG